MSPLSQETRHVQNPALGAVLLWRYALGWSEHNRIRAYPALPLLFVVLPILLHQDTFDLLKSTKRPTGLHGFAEKFSSASSRKSDVLMGIHSRAASWRRLTWQSIQLGVRARLFSVSRSGATVIPLTKAQPSALPTSIRPLLANAEKLGEWCANLSMFEVATILKVQF